MFSVFPVSIPMKKSHSFAGAVERGKTPKTRKRENGFKGINNRTGSMLHQYEYIEDPGKPRETLIVDDLYLKRRYLLFLL